MGKFGLTMLVAAFGLSTIFSPLTYGAMPPRYVAMGDSVAAGGGLPSTDTVCGRSLDSYPHAVAAALGTTVTDLTCSGAKVDEGIYGRQAAGRDGVAPQLDRAFADGTPDVITMTIGANDVRWVQFMQKCQIVTCGTTFDNATSKVLRGDLRVELYWALYRIERMSDGHPPQVLLTGYYTPLANTICPGTERVTVSERNWLRARTADLNQAIRSVANKFSFAKYVPINFTGHELCTDESWVQGLSESGPLHPNAAGEDAMARAVLRVLRSGDVF